MIDHKTIITRPRRAPSKQVDIREIKPPEQCNRQECEELMYLFLGYHCIDAVEKYRNRLNEILEFNKKVLLCRK